MKGFLIFTVFLLLSLITITQFNAYPYNNQSQVYFSPSTSNNIQGESKFEIDIPIFTESSRIICNQSYDISSFDFPGSGVEEDPFLIENLNITIYNPPLIYIEDTDAYIKISNCLFNTLTFGATSIELWNVSNCIIINNTFINGGCALSADSLDNSSFSYNLVYNFINFGVRLFSGCSNNIISNNDFIQFNVDRSGLAYDSGSKNSFRSNFWGTGFQNLYVISGFKSVDSNPQPSPNNPTFIHYITPPDITSLSFNPRHYPEDISIQWLKSIDSFNHSLSYSIFYSDLIDSYFDPMDYFKLTWVQIVSNLLNTDYTWVNNSDFPKFGEYIFKVVTICTEGLSIESESLLRIDEYYPMFAFKGTLASLFILIIALRVRKKIYSRPI